MLIAPYPCGAGALPFGYLIMRTQRCNVNTFGKIFRVMPAVFFYLREIIKLCVFVLIRRFYGLVAVNDLAQAFKKLIPALAGLG